ncbi:MAG TPA: hypothetical protein VHM91_00445 [Verrucomicrobiales bacterium]|nr:hypothetical protein [Verrucomicrobiales bacterium]
MPSSPATPVEEAQLYGGTHDGRDVLITLRPTGPPPAIRHSGCTYLLDGRLSDGRPRYSRPSQRWPFHGDNG